METTETLVPVEEYLRTSFDPDRDYVDGRTVERNEGENDHSSLQTELAIWFGTRRGKLKLWVYVEQRVQVSPHRFRVPDVCVVKSKATEQIFHKPPHICIEVLSPEDSLMDMQERIDDYLAFGVPNIWVINPASRRAWIYTAAGSSEAKDGILRATDPEVVLPLAEVFEPPDLM
jgi:Uma2 family endonuclease